MIRAGFDEEERGKYDHEADFAAAAADRLPFPASRASGLCCVFDGVKSAFHHPLGGGGVLKFSKPIESSELGEKTEQMAQPQPVFPDDWSEAEKWRARFFAHWRVWYRNVIEKDWRMGFLPADTRIPDHTIWNHMQIVSALAGCGFGKGRKPAFLRVKIGGVQEFIAQARSTRDLWSGSYLISWLMACALKKLTEEVGPDAVIFPSLNKQPLFDLWWRNELWAKICAGKNPRSYWDTFGYDAIEGCQKLLTPNLPNTFLAVVPADNAAQLGKRCVDAIQDELKEIADSVWMYCENEGLTKDEASISETERHERFKRQIDRMLDVSWQTEPWPESLDEAVKLAGGATEKSSLYEAGKRVVAIRTMAETEMPKNHRDQRYYTDPKEKDNLNNIGLAWSILVADQSARFDAVRHTNAFTAWASGGWGVGTHNNKDALNGREEAVAGGREWKDRCLRCSELANLFKHDDDWIGASTLVKRVWHRAYLCEGWGFKPDDFKMPNTYGVANHDPDTKCDDDDVDKADEKQLDKKDSSKYFAVIALDGDEMGKWVSGEKTPSFETQLANYDGGGSLEYFKRNALGDFVTTQRPVSPSYHLQFSEALSNYANNCAARIVEAYDGRLIYAGGDDVLAMLPADTAIPCAIALRKAFRGEKPDERKSGIDSKAPGFLTLDDDKDDHRRGTPIPFIVPGLAADCSVGIAIAHCKEPLQDVVREAQAAEKRAKDFGRCATSISLLKHSGETVNWSTKWDGGGLLLVEQIMNAMSGAAAPLSKRFPHALQELLVPYCMGRDTGLSKINNVDGFDVCAIITSELARCLERQKTRKGDAAIIAQIEADFSTYVDQLKANGKSQDEITEAVCGLLKTAAFISRNKWEGK